MSSIQLEVNSLPVGETTYQTLYITLTKPQALISPDSIVPLPLPIELDLSREVVISGQAPLWLQVRLMWCCREAPWVGCHAARDNQIVVIHSKVASPTVGDSFPIRLNRRPCPAILISGPPNSGKSVFSNALRRALLTQGQRVFLHRASWDGEGNWSYESDNPSLVDSLVRHNEFRIHEDPKTAKQIPDFFEKQARTVANLRQLTDCLLVDVGGLPQLEKIPLVKQCSHYIVISRLPSEVEKWHKLCESHLTALAVIHSVLEPTQQVVKELPILEIKAGPWLLEQEPVMPDAVLEVVLQSLWERN
ncbi:crispr-associated csx3 family [Leptolyngbya sp. Heron Island J]|uniref:CRISPR-associated protein Csx3 n=1 Tax=Leptolyngbya sp. Heron Island J TaxID=1385935 RepID=UPI0003B9D76E|nr:CRISPR-associated protein Csx3 [Leptolyngbya sp. Heron Island J]ESA34652.1 crispr-associated csx3 family [Leptolyngbya sp. Heron Island J]